MAASALIGTSLLGMVQGHAQGVQQYFENGGLVRGSRAPTALGPTLFGDRHNGYTGTADFVQTDLTLPGNGSLDIKLSRRLITGVVTSPGASYDVPRMFGDWELELPQLQVMTAKEGWLVGLTASDAGSANRCRRFGEELVATHRLDGAPAQPALPVVQMRDLSGGSQDLLWRAASTFPQRSDGAVYPVVTKSGWQLRCIAVQTASGGKGEGFEGVAPDGSVYRFDWLVSRKMSNGYVSLANIGGAMRAGVGKQEQSLTRVNPDAPTPAAMVRTGAFERLDVRLRATRVTDRFGNWLNYNYDTSLPWRLNSITASDGRQVTLEYADASRPELITGVSDGTRRWSYAYEGRSDELATQAFTRLKTVTLPDGSAWKFSGASLQYAPSVLSTGCHETTARGFSATKIMEHPSGARAEFSFKNRVGPMLLGPCTGPVPWSPETKMFSGLVLTRKTLSGPGMATATWSYGDYSLVGTDKAAYEVTGPTGERVRYTYGIGLTTNGGQLFSVEEGWDGSRALRTTSYTYRSETAGPYSAVFGNSFNGAGDGQLQAKNRPTESITIQQQGVTFSYTATAFDGLARATKWTRRGPGGTLNEEVVYTDLLGPWVLGLESQRNQAGTRVSENTWGTLGQLKERRSFGVLQSRADYNADGSLAWKEDGGGHRTYFDDYKRGVPRSIRYADGSSESVTVNDLGLITRHIDPSGNSTEYGYDAAGRLSSITPPSGWTPTSLRFEPVAGSEYGLDAGHWRQTVSKGNAITQTYFDGLWRPVMTRTYDAGKEASTRKVVVKGYDASGRASFESYPARDYATVALSSPGTRTSYDALGRLKRTEADSELGVLASSVDYLDGFKTQLTNARGKVSTQSFWALDKPDEAQLAGLDAPEGVSVRIERDVFGKPTAITRGGVTRRYVYDAGQRLCKTIEPEINATIQDYDAAGNVAWRAPGQALTGTATCDTAAVTSAAKISYGYDALNRLTSTSFGDDSPGITRSYWADGKPKTVESNGSIWSYGYNSLRLLTTETLSYAGQSIAFSWDYNPNGHLSSLSYPATGTVLSYLPNALGEPSQIELSTPAGKIPLASGVNFHPNGAVAGYRLGNGIQHTLTQNLRGLPETNEDLGVMKDAYVYDANGNVSGIADKQENVFSRSMVYDDLDRLKSVSAPGVWGTASYSYDAADNLRTANVGSRSATLNYTDGTNRLNSVTVNGSTSAYTYDPYGNIRSKGGQSYTFDLGNRMSAAGTSNRYVYDGLGRRVLTQLKDGSTRMTVYSQSGQLLGSVMAGGGLSSPVKTIYVYLAGKEIAETNDKNELWYTHTDALGSPVARTNAGGGVMSRTRYEPYGYVAQGTKPGPNTGLMGFTGHVQDPETELVYMQQRYYDPIAGRFLSVDPIVTDANTGAGFGLYTYVDNNPYAKIDPDGRAPAECSESCTRMRAISDAHSLGRSTTSAIDSFITGGYGAKFSQSLSAGNYGQAAVNLAAGAGYGVMNVLTLGEGAAVNKLVSGMGGQFSKLVGTVGDNLTAHHIPQAALKFTSRAEGGAVVMTAAEHEATRTYGARGALTKIEDATLSFRDVLAKDVRDIRSIVGSKYNDGIRDVINYYREKFPQLMERK